MFQGGNVQYFTENWCKCTKHPYILDIITNGLKLVLNEIPKHNNMSTYLCLKKKQRLFL